MKRLSIFITLILCSVQLAAQVRLRIVINAEPSTHKNDSLFVAGSFNDWNPRDKAYIFQKSKNGFPSIDLSVPPGNHEFKITRGSWAKVEANKNGSNISNRKLKIRKDTTVFIRIEGWADDFKQEQVVRKSTASSRVSVYDTAFSVPQLERKKGIRIYLPPGYENSATRFPVIYMHDAQNLFDESSSSFGEEWGVDETLDSMIANGAIPAIIVGIDNDSKKRMNEYNPYDHEKFGTGEGDAYIRFVAETLKPHIDKNFRTLSSSGHTTIAGSSMGGLISLYAVLKYPEVFGNAGIFSPAFWTAKGIEADVKSLASKVKGKVWFYSGGKESDFMVPDMQKIEKAFRENSKAATTEIVDQDAGHNEKAWRTHFPEFYKWIMQ